MSTRKTKKGRARNARKEADWLPRVVFVRRVGDDEYVIDRNEGEIRVTGDALEMLFDFVELAPHQRETVISLIEQLHAGADPAAIQGVFDHQRSLN